MSCNGSDQCAACEPEETIVKPITPDEVKKRHYGQIPDYIFEAFNQLIVNAFDGDEAIVKQEDVVALVKKKGHEVNFKHLDVEDHYANAGWDVHFDKPGYNETYPATFKFRRKYA